MGDKIIIIRPTNRPTHTSVCTR